MHQVVVTEAQEVSAETIQPQRVVSGVLAEPVEPVEPVEPEAMAVPLPAAESYIWAQR